MRDSQNLLHNKYYLYLLLVFRVCVIGLTFFPRMSSEHLHI